MQRGSRVTPPGEIHVDHRDGVRDGSRPAAPREIHVDRLIAELAARRGGLVERSELHARGVTRREIERRLASGHIHTIHRGVYAVGHPKLSPLSHARAALIAVGPHSALSHRTAAVQLELVAPDGGPIHLTHNPPHRRGPTGVILHRAALTAAEVGLVHNLPTTSPARTLTDLAGSHPGELPRALNEALVRKLVEPHQLRPAGRGALALRALLVEGLSPTRSEAERRLLKLILRAQLPRPETNVPLRGYEVDALWRAPAIVVEIDGFAAHGTKRAFERDRARDADLTAAGYRVMRFTWRQLTVQPERVVATLAAALARS